MRNRYAAGALALSAGLSAYTLYALPRGGVARSWTTTTGARLEARRAPKAAVPEASRPSTGISASQALAAAAVAQPKPGQVYGSFFAQRAAEPVFRARPSSTRPDMASLIVADRGPDRVVGSAADSTFEPSAASTGKLEGFRWQNAPQAGDLDDSK